MKILKRILDKAQSAFLYETHLVIFYFKKVGGVKQECAAIWELEKGFVSCDLSGAIFFKKEAVPLLSILKGIKVTPGSVNSGSKNSQELGIVVEPILMNFGAGWFNLSTMPDVISADIQYLKWYGSYYLNVSNNRIRDVEITEYHIS